MPRLPSTSTSSDWKATVRYSIFRRPLQLCPSLLRGDEETPELQGQTALPRREKLPEKGGTCAGRHRLLAKRGQERSQPALSAPAIGQSPSPRPGPAPTPPAILDLVPRSSAPLPRGPRARPPAAPFPRLSQPGPGPAAPRAPTAAGGAAAASGLLPRAAGTAQG